MSPQDADLESPVAIDMSPEFAVDALPVAKLMSSGYQQQMIGMPDFIDLVFCAL